MEKPQASSKDESGTGRQQVAAERRGWAVGGPESSQIHRKAQGGLVCPRGTRVGRQELPAGQGEGRPVEGLARECGETAFSVGLRGSRGRLSRRSASRAALRGGTLALA